MCKLHKYINVGPHYTACKTQKELEFPNHIDANDNEADAQLKLVLCKLNYTNHVVLIISRACRVPQMPQNHKVRRFIHIPSFMSRLSCMA